MHLYGDNLIKIAQHLGHDVARDIWAIAWGCDTAERDSIAYLTWSSTPSELSSDRVVLSIVCLVGKCLIAPMKYRYFDNDNL